MMAAHLIVSYLTIATFTTLLLRILAPPHTSSPSLVVEGLLWPRFLWRTYQW